ncbi:unnamed protein product [Heterobilharzia americana]|nr:unnamed protein product [Heterobilharzia americana]
MLPNLIRLDISSNELTSLPTELGFMDSLMVLIINCNSIRSIRQSIISGSTEAIKSLLRQRHKSSDEDFEYTLQSVKNCLDTVKSEANKESIYSTNGINDNNVNSVVSSMKSLLSDQKQNPIIHYEIHLPPVSSSGILDWSGVTQKSSTTSVTNIPQLPSLNVQSEWIQAATPPNSQGNIPVVKSLLLLHRSLLQVPQGLFVFASDLTSLNISYNQLTSLPENLDQLTKLGSLDVSNNKLRCLPVCLSNLSELITLRLDSNPFASQLPYDILFKIPLIKKLECLSVRGCQLDSCPTYEHLNPTNAPNLKCLDIGNNNIGQLPVELGLCTQIRSLHVDGNTFRVPRSSIVAKGTESILDYLRSRIPT